MMMETGDDPIEFSTFDQITHRISKIICSADLLEIKFPQRSKKSTSKICTSEWEDF